MIQVFRVSTKGSRGSEQGVYLLISITPIHKKDKSNYRFVAKLSLIAKAFQSLVTDNIFQISTPNLTGTETERFFKGRSTATNLVGINFQLPWFAVVFKIFKQIRSLDD